MESDTVLISAVKSHPCLYNRRSADFKVEQKKEEAWTAISQTVDRPGEPASLLTLLATGLGKGITSGYGGLLAT